MMKQIGRILTLFLGLAVLGVVMLYMMGAFRTGVIEPGLVEAGPPEAPPDNTTTASLEKIPQWYEAVGTVRPRTEANISSQVSGRILSVEVRAGDRVKKGDPLIRLDNRESQARVNQALRGVEAAQAEKGRAEQGLAAARAAYRERQSQYQRVKKYYAQQAATRRDLEQAEAAHLQAQAGVQQAVEAVAAAQASVERAGQVVKEAQVGSGYATIDAPEAGQIVKRLADPGDMAWPGKPLLVLQAPGSMRLEAHVREGLIGTVLPGSRLRVRIDALNADLEGTVDEIAPSADPASRTFIVKVNIPALEGLYTGMFGRLRVPLEEREAVLIPGEAVRRIGQMEIVRVKEGERWSRLFIKTGREVNGKVEVLSGLAGNELLALDE